MKKRNNHLFQREDNYFVLNLDNMKIFRLPQKMNRLLNGKTKDELGIIEKELCLEDSNDYRELKINKENEKYCKRLVLNVTNACNLACKYCYAEEGKYASEQKVSMMSIDVLKMAVELACDIYSDGIRMIQFFGGEPLLNRKLMLNCIPEIKQIFEGRNIKEPIYTVVTNGTLIDDEYIELFNRYFESITISLDGYKDINDSNRCYAENNDSVYDIIMETMEKINREKRNFYVAVEATITKNHIDDFKKTGRVSTLELLQNLDIDASQHGPLIDKKTISSSLANSDEEDVIKYFEEWIKQEFSSGNDKVRCRTIANIIDMYKKGKIYSNGCGATQTDLAIDVTGDIYPCFMFIGLDEFCLGNVKRFNIREYNKTRAAILNIFNEANSNEKCNECWIKGMCEKTYGHCIGARYLQNGDIKLPIDLACNISKSVLERIIYETCDKYGTRKE